MFTLFHDQYNRDRVTLASVEIVATNVRQRFSGGVTWTTEELFIAEYQSDNNLLCCTQTPEVLQTVLTPLHDINLNIGYYGYLQ